MEKIQQFCVAYIEIMRMRPAKSIPKFMNAVKLTLHFAFEANKNENMTCESNFEIGLRN